MQSPAPGTPQGELVLNVDDTEPIRYAKTRTLKSGGYRVIEAGDGATALALVAEHRPGLVLLDVRLPDMSGMDVCRIIKRDFPGVMVLQVSATFTAAGHRVEGLDAGADSYLTQPVEPEELIAAVNALLRLKQAEDALRQLADTLEQRVAERTAQLAEANRELRIQIEERERAEEQLRHSQKMEAVGQLTGGIAHDFNNLLTGIIGSLELMRTRLEQGRAAGLDRYIEAALAASHRAATLTHRLLAFARRQPLDPKPIDVNRLVLAIEELVRRTVGPGIRVRTALDEHIGTALCDPNQMENALLNLVINARDAMPEGGELVIATRDLVLEAAEEDMPPGRYLSLAVADTGTGMTPDVIARAFDPFFTTKPLGQGTGLGLSMLYGFIRQSDGQVRIESKPGSGTTVTMILPQHAIDATEEMSVSAAALARSTQGETVLLVDDEDIVRMLAGEMLEELGYRVLQASDAQAALALLASGPEIHLLVTDIGLPGMSGRQLAEAAWRTRPGLRVLFVTGYAGGADPFGTARTPHSEVIMKPFALAALGAKVQHLLRA